MTRHVMMFEAGRKPSRGKGRRGRAKTTKKSSAMVRKVRAVKRTLWNVLGGVGLVVMIWWLIQIATRSGWWM